MLRLTRVFVIGLAVLTVVEAFIEDHEAAEEVRLGNPAVTFLLITILTGESRGRWSL